MLGYLVSQFGKGVYDSITSLNILVKIVGNNITKSLIYNLLFYNLVICLGINYLVDNYPYCIQKYYNLDNSYTLYLYRVFVNLFWLLPNYVIGLMYNSYYTNQAIGVFIHVYNPQNLNLKYHCYGRYSRYLVNKGYYQVIITFLTLETILISYLPYIGTFMDWFLTSLIYSYYSWEYSWSSHKVPHSNRYAIFENNWSYYLGYGTIIGLIKINMGFFNSSYIIASIFPIVCMNTLVLFKKDTTIITDNPYKFKIPLFYFPIRYADRVVKRISEYLKIKLT